MLKILNMYFIIYLYNSKLKKKPQVYYSAMLFITFTNIINQNMLIKG